ncbi:capsular polysaccharide biosynthsis protein [Klebsiella variicola]|nr:capsular polysaccharide biosynthsis protein [Klebsiella variicola]
MCKVSVIIPVYNVEKYLSECIDSLLEQTFEEAEFIFVNDVVQTYLPIF